MNTVEKTATGVTPTELILNNSLRLECMRKSVFALSYGRPWKVQFDLRSQKTNSLSNHI